MYEQQIGCTVVSRTHNTPVTVKGQPNHTHYWMYKNYSIALDKGYNGSIEMEDAIPRTPSAHFHERFGEENICHAMCNEFVEALNGFMMNEVRRSQVGGEDDVAKLDDIMKRMIGTRLEDFLVYFCA
ncbi:hypothetical protein TWF103_004829 [Orbilia oligospora]|nr:hypothetical protein TWF103_004829 [Orbilia oligospora]